MLEIVNKLKNYVMGHTLYLGLTVLVNYVINIRFV
jgi:hypothetical protein